MPHKTCPQCSSEHGVRKKVCECGYEFSKQGSASPANGKVGSAEDINKDINSGKRNYRESDLGKDKLSITDVKRLVSYEGIGECIWHLIPATNIKDAKLRKKWMDARNKMQEIVRQIYE